MESTLYLVDDIAAILKGISIAHADIAARLSSREALAYRAGFSAAIRAVASAVHVSLDVDHATALREPDPNCYEELDCYVVSLVGGKLDDDTSWNHCSTPEGT